MNTSDRDRVESWSGTPAERGRHRRGTDREMRRGGDSLLCGMMRTKEPVWRSIGRSVENSDEINY